MKRPAVPGILRLVDANLNRCREALRVLEDTARFVWDERRLFESFRSARHGLDRMSRPLYPDLIAERESGSDRGRKIREPGRRGLRGLVTANFKRCGESLRVLEEYGKLFSARGAARMKAMRFRIYRLEKDVLGPGGPCAG